MELKTETNNNGQEDLAIVEVKDAKQVENLEAHHHSCHSSCGCSDVELLSFNIEPIVTVKF